MLTINTTITEKALISEIAAMQFSFSERPEGELATGVAITIDGVACGKVAARTDLIEKSVAKSVAVVIPTADCWFLAERTEGGFTVSELPE